MKLDEIYEDAKAAGKLNSVSIFGGASLPWTNEATENMNKDLNKQLKEKRGEAGKKLSPSELATLKKNLFKPIKTPPKAEEVTKPKKFFGLF